MVTIPAAVTEQMLDEVVEENVTGTPDAPGVA
jgi:hypothetical protein